MSLQRLPVIQPRSALREDGGRNFVYPADVHGRFATARVVAFIVLIGIYGIVPWIDVGGHPAVFLDIDRRAFYLFGFVFNAQDIWLTVFLLTGAAFSLLYITAVAGRVWCGWACPQTVFLEGVYRRIERLVEGPREQRIRRKKGPWNVDRVARTALSHVLYAATSVLLAHVFLSYFVSIPGLFRMVQKSPSQHPEAFVVVSVLSAVLYFNFSWFREQFCVVLCPYGRLQSVLIDEDSLVVGYDVRRGEPRGKMKEEGRGDCVDCGRCVVVCPTGIDIRNGLQMDCVGCTACIDACDEIMDRLGKPRGLVRYDSQRGLAGATRRFVRPRIIIYTAALLLGMGVATFAFTRHRDFEANVLRTSGSPYVIENGTVRNAFEVHLVNKRSDDTLFVIEPVAVGHAAFVVPLKTVRLAPLASATAPIFVILPLRDATHDFDAKVKIRTSNADSSKTLTLRILGPRS